MSYNERATKKEEDFSQGPHQTQAEHPLVTENPSWRVKCIILKNSLDWSLDTCTLISSNSICD
uniref:Uncharacterized protein n=1 Tax=Rhizophora mucronata TaxID=61149 RepID=A0A2P2NXP8_RHIMU